MVSVNLISAMNYTINLTSNFEKNSSSLRSSRFLSFSKGSRTGGKLWKSDKILTHTLLTSPQFFGSPRRAPSLARFSFACSISAPPEKGKESTAKQAKIVRDKSDVAFLLVKLSESFWQVKEQTKCAFPYLECRMKNHGASSSVLNLYNVWKFENKYTMFSIVVV